MNSKFKKFNTFDNNELIAVSKVIKSGNLSSFLGKDGKFFLGGKKVREFEKKIEKYFDVKYAITVNSWTSGLIASFGAIGLEPGDEVILPTWTMSACAIAILNWNAIPIFADIDKKTFNIDPISIKKLISKKTKAILVVDIFGKACNYDEILKIAKKHKLKVICDSAQAPGAKYKDRFVGTLGDIGGFSLNYHKHIHTGEGGIIVTNSKYYAQRLRLIRNHAESSVNQYGYTKKKYLINLLGYNFRLGEIEAAIGIEQLKKLKRIIKKRRQTAHFLIKELSKINGLILPEINQKEDNIFYFLPILLDKNLISKKKSIITNFLKKNDIPIVSEYENIHLKPIFQNLISYGSKNFPWSLDKRKYHSKFYSKGTCPNAEYTNQETFFAIPLCLYDFSNKDLEKIIRNFNKVWIELKLN